jgi:phosphohistidine phosphatase
MKTLLLMRHAKSDWSDENEKDFDRPLKKRGKKDAPRMAELLKEEKLIPEKILCSAAKRTRQTAELMLEACDKKIDVDYLESLYLAEPKAYFEALRRLPDETKSVMVIGHNPGLEGLLQIISKKVETLPTATVAQIKLPIKHWKELDGKVEGKLVSVWRPREVKDKD